MFAPDIVERAKPTSSKQHETPLDEEAQIHLDTDMANLEVHDDVKYSEQIIQEKEAEIREMNGRFSKEYFFIYFFQQENKQLKVKQLFLDKSKAGLEKDTSKGKIVIKLEEIEAIGFHLKPRRPKTRGLKSK